MTKELKAWEIIKRDALYHIQSVDMVGFNRQEEIQKEKKRIGVIETALKRYQPLMEAHPLNIKNNMVLEIIKDRFNIQFIKSDLPNYYGIMQIGANPIYIKTKEEFDLLKEVLL